MGASSFRMMRENNEKQSNEVVNHAEKEPEQTKAKETKTKAPRKPKQVK